MSEALPDEVQMRADVTLCLVQAMIQRLGISGSDIKPEMIPSKPPISADAGAWGIVLATYAENIKVLRAAYAAYAHQPLYTQETVDKKFSQTVIYLAKKLHDQLDSK